MVAATTIVVAIVLALLFVVHASAAAIVVRFYRLQVRSLLATIIYVAITVPAVYLVTTLVLFGALGIGTGVTIDRSTLFMYLWALPFVFGAAFERFWMPPPEVPEGEQRERRRHGE